MQFSSSVPSGQSCQPSHTDSSARHSPLPQENSVGLQVSARAGHRMHPSPKDGDHAAPAGTSLPVWLLTLCGIAGFIGGKEPSVCYSFICHKENCHDMARRGQGGWQLVATEPAGTWGKRGHWVCRTLKLILWLTPAAHSMPQFPQLSHRTHTCPSGWQFQCLHCREPPRSQSCNPRVTPG